MGPDTDNAALWPLVSSLPIALTPPNPSLPLPLWSPRAAPRRRAEALLSHWRFRGWEPLINDERRVTCQSPCSLFARPPLKQTFLESRFGFFSFSSPLLHSRRSLLEQPPNRASLEARQLLLISQPPLRQHSTQARGRFTVSSGGSCERPGAPSGSGNRASSINWKRRYCSNSL